MKKYEVNEIKILATLGPASMEKSIVKNMDFAGVDLFRINLSHTDIKNFEEIVKKIQSWTKKPVCIDSEGAQIRTAKIKNGRTIVKNNSFVFLTSSEILGDKYHIPLYPVEPSDILKLGDILAIDFHSIVVQVVNVKENNVRARVISGGEIRSNKAVNLDRLINLPSFTEKDLKALEISKKMGLNYFALSFAADKNDVQKIRNIFPYPIFVISKIESRFGLINLENICQVSDALLIDRGDLSREVPLQKIALAQKHILNVANKLKVPVYVATNLLENMVSHFEPTRAEINDITNTLLDGSKGLVLASETAIGKHPVQSVRMAVNIKQEVKNYISSGKKNYFDSIYDYNLIEPHGGVLVQNFINSDKNKPINNLSEINLGERILSDVVQIAEGTYSPLKGFMNKTELMSVLESYKLPNGIVWTLPILLQMNKKDIKFSRGERIALKREKDGICCALMDVKDIEKINLGKVAKKWFGVDEIKHPGVFKFKKQGDYIISGEVFLIKKPNFSLDSYSLNPKQTRQIFRKKGWQKIVGFHTRNVIHRGHEFIQKKALKMIGADALFISPVIGQKKEKDFSAQAIIKSYEIMIDNNYYGRFPALIGAFNTYSRYSGPREAVFTALCRKNFGCSHFVVGRDHTGVGSYYSSDASSKIFDDIGNIGIIPLTFKAVYFCKSCDKNVDGCDHREEKKLSLSGTKAREQLLKGLDVPKYLMRPEISKELRKMSEGPGKLFED